MIFTLSWLKEHLETTASLKEICAMLDAIGIEVDKLTDHHDELSNFKVAQIIETKPHPDADKLQICQVITHDGTKEIVCGAPNARAGIKVVFGGIGTSVPGLMDDNGKAFILKKAKIRGIESSGMMLSLRELGLGEEHDGIIELPAEAEIGDNIAAYLGVDDPIIEVEITPNRGDWLGVRNIARELAACGLGQLKPLSIPSIKTCYPSPKKVVYKDQAAQNACPWFVGRVIRNVQNTQSPPWLQQRLKAVGLRPISALVDITNYLTIDLCRPAHFFDSAQLQGDITLRMAQDGETLKALDEKEYQLKNNMLVVADEQSAQSIAGVMGAMTSGCSDDTNEIFLELALFDPVSVAMTGRQLSLQSDARYRFERGVDRSFLLNALEIATQMVLDICGGEPSEVVQAGAPVDEPEPISYRMERVSSLAGIDIDKDRQIQILENLGFTVEPSLDAYKVQEPSWRWDHEGEAGIVEEVIRIHGLDKIEAVSLEATSQKMSPAQNNGQRKRERLRQLLAIRGCWEAITFSFMDSRKAALFTELKDHLYVANPVSSELNYMRPSLLPNLLDAAANNAKRGLRNIDLFEIGATFHGDGDQEQPIGAAAIRSGYYNERHWQGSPRLVDVFDAKADALAALSVMDVATNHLTIIPKAPSYFHPARSGALGLGAKNILAYFGEIHPKLLSAFGLKTSVVAMELFPDNIPQKKRKNAYTKATYMPSDLMPLSRDFAFVAPIEVAAEKLRKAALLADKKLITSVDIFDVFEGGSLEKGQKSIGMNVTIQPIDKTLNEAELEILHHKIIAAVEKQGALLRSS